MPTERPWRCMSGHIFFSDLTHDRCPVTYGWDMDVECYSNCRPLTEVEQTIMRLMGFDALKKELY